MPPGIHITSDSDLESVISLQDATIKPRRRSTGPKYICSIEGCGAKFSRLTHLDRHEYKHSGVKRHICTYEGCGKAYSIVAHLKRHLRTTHDRTAPTPKDVSCTVDGCEKLFQSVCNMQRHVREVHENPKVYRCPYCSERFTQKLKMRRHEITQHTGNFPYSCYKCAKGFYTRWQYERHLPSCKTYSCHNCGAHFEKWSLYRKHCMETQHGRMCYKCDSCELVFHRPGELQRHVICRHSDAAGGNEPMYKCTHDGCDRRYAHERNLKQHVRTAHKGERFHCVEKDCTRVFSSAQNLSRHAAREHKQALETKGRGPIITKTEKPKSIRRKRYDAGQSLFSNLSKLSGLAVNRSFDKLLRKREETALSEVTKVLALALDADQMTTESEDEKILQTN